MSSQNSRRLTLVAAILIAALLLKKWLRARRNKQLLKQRGEGKAIVITGAASGLGFNTALFFARRGWKVYAADVDKTGLDRLQDLSRAEKIDVVCFETDVTDEDSCKALLNLVKPLGKLDVLVNCAGITSPSPALDMPMNLLEKQVNVNLIGPIRLCQLFMPLLVKGDGGTIVNVSSISAVIAWPFQGAYSTSKFGLDSFSVVARREAFISNLHKKLRVKVVRPGPIDTPLADRQFIEAKEWVRNNPDSLFVGGLASLCEGRNKVTVETAKAIAMIPPQVVSKEIYCSAVDPDAPFSKLVVTPLFYVVYHLLVLLPESLADRLLTHF